MGAQEEIEAAALALIDEAGRSGLTVRAVAARAHYHRSTVMYHIGSMEQLELRLRSKIAAELAHGVEALPGGDDSADRVICQQLLSYWHRSRNRLEFFASKPLDHELVNIDRPQPFMNIFGHVPTHLVIPATRWVFANFSALVALLEHMADDDARMAALLDNLHVTRARLETYRFAGSV